MGYRSNIKLVISFDNKVKSAQDILKGLDPKVIASFDGFKIEHDGENDYIKFQDNWVKWYDDYPEVAEFNKWKEKLYDYFNDNPEVGGYCFSRMGEDPSDCEYEEAGEPLIGIAIRHTNEFEDGEEITKNEFKKPAKKKNKKQ